MLASAGLHAAWNLFAKRAGGATRGPAFVWVFSALTAVIFAPWAIARGGLRLPDAGVEALLVVVGSAVLHVGYFLSLQRGYRVGDLSLVYPLARGGGPALATLGAIVWLGERPSPWALAGSALVVLATVTLASARPTEGQKLGPGLRWGAVTALFIAAYTLWDARAVAQVGVPPLLFLWWSEVTRAVLLAPLALLRAADVREVVRLRLGSVLAVAVLSPLAYLLVLTAFTMAPVSLVAPTREVSVLIGAWLGVTLLGESGRERRLFAAVLMVAGIALLVRG